MDTPHSKKFLRELLGKVKAPVEFGARLDVSIGEDGYGRLEKVSFDAYNESSCLTAAVERYKSRTGHYPERVLADQIYRTRDNHAYCKKYGIRLSGPKPGRPSPDARADRKQTYQDNTDRIDYRYAFGSVRNDRNS